MHMHPVPYLSFQRVLLPGHCECNDQRSLTSSGAAACTALTAGQFLTQRLSLCEWLCAKFDDANSRALHRLMVTSVTTSHTKPMLCLAN